MATSTDLDSPIPTIAASSPFAVLGADAARKKAIADLLLRQGFGQSDEGQMVSGHYIAPSPLSALAKVGSVLASSRLDKQSNQQQLQLAQQYQQGQSSALQDFQQKLQGDDRMGAIVQAAASPYPGLQKVAQAMLANMPGGDKLIPLVGKVTPDSLKAVAQTGDLSRAVPVETQEAGVPKQQIIDVGDKAHVVTPAQGAPAYGPAQAGIGGAPVQRNLLGGKDAYGPVAQHVNVQATNLPPNVAAVEAIKHGYDRLDPAYEGALNGQQAYTALDTAEKALQNSITGTGAAQRVQLTRALQTLGMPSSDIAKLGDTASLRNALTLAAAQTAKSQTGARVSNYEEQIFQKVGGADPNATPEEVEQAIKIGKAKAANNILQYNGQLQGLARDPDMAPHLNSYSAVPEISLGDGYHKNDKTGLYQIDEAAQEQPTGQTAAPNIIRYDNQGNRIQ